MSSPLERHVAGWIDDIVKFAKDVFDLELDAWQVIVAREVVKGNRVAMQACKGPGKTFLLAVIVWWFLATRPHPKVACTSISGDNLKDGLWTELSKLQKRSPLLRAKFTWTKERVFSNEHPETWWASARKWSKDSDPQQQANTLAGLHADYILFVIDEAGGVPDGVASAAEAALASGIESKIILAGNPTHLEGPLYRAATTERPLWYIHEITADPDDPLRAPRVSVEWARELIAKHGRKHSIVLVNVLGKFPEQQSNVLIGVNDVQDSAKRILPNGIERGFARILGIDVARFGDDASVFFGRQGLTTTMPKAFYKQDSMYIAGQAAVSIGKWHPDGVFVDASGGYGAGVVDRLQQLNYDVIGIEFGGSALNDAKFVNRRTEMWWLMAEWIKGGGKIPDDAQLRRELLAPHYDFDGANRIRLEEKKEIKKRLGFSPDFADALALTFALPVQARPEEWDALPGAERRARRVQTDLPNDDEVSDG